MKVKRVKVRIVKVIVTLTLTVKRVMVTVAVKKMNGMISVAFVGSVVD